MGQYDTIDGIEMFKIFCLKYAIIFYLRPVTSWYKQVDVLIKSIDVRE